VPAIRAATLEDAAAIAGLMTALGYPTESAAMRARLEQIGGHPDYAALVDWVLQNAWGMPRRPVPR